MNWYEKLNQYFPVQEMKSEKHFNLLLNEKGDIYKKDEGPYHVLLYAELKDFIFIDYIYVSKDARGKGIGHKIIDRLKNKNKAIILEVEPVNYQDSDTEKRLHFYAREDFRHAKRIGYERKSLATDELNVMEILYWTPTNESEESILEKMKKTYEEIHTYKDDEIYGESYQPVEEVLTLDQEKDDILEQIQSGIKS
ncbi:GNAT family N-acetyltransferase [Bacillus carboniphilus]|uniref:GNAT family N-acetyltransferase n=1 Tax=Bacillus carboniphilus TaxID=86663 RepID=A0ABY9JXJ9_9BACI|nr:GNAT family N-acetyltransferase [Bacillus carboniphilus]WLR43053.1 GNAT family N-acetyltransferase [Bacillus carboniphilus]